uniref:Protein translocase subunit SecA n=1 Tax=Anotrichium furcellatum TaxID=41999 RepID=A0A4D6WNP9_9FLOR|nr:Preprotein-translocase subunit a [Anotrichium furcellatum]
MFNFFLYNPINKYKKTLEKINKIYSQLHNFSNTKLKNQTYKFKKQISENIKSIDQILPEAFATVKEAIKRAYNITLFDVQILGAIVLHEGYIAEMQTGEGKTLVATLPSYLNCLNNNNVHIVTVNDYLANRDANFAKKIFEYLDITIGLVIQSTTYIEKKIQYKSNIIYITNSELGFDYLRDNMAIDVEDIVQEKFYYAIVDEVDSILIDEARTPLIISGTAEKNNKKYSQAKQVSDCLSKDKDYEIDEKSRNISLTESGIILCEEILEVDNLYNINNPWIKYILNAIKAKELFTKNKDYIVKNQEVTIVDEFTGRVMEGRRWSDGLHQAIEAKENIEIKPENKTLASITYQNLFLTYEKLCGMTGTAKTEEAEFNKIYKLNVITIPPNQTCKRKDLPDLVYKSEFNKWQAIANECYDMYQIGQPTLIGTTSIEKSELLAKMLDELKIPYNLLNAKPQNIARESEIITQAGKQNAITISTNMAGRGTDIILGGNANTISKLIIGEYIKNNLPVNQDEKQNQYPDLIEKILRKIDTKIFIKQNNIETYIDYIINQNNISAEEKSFIDLYREIVSIYQNKFKNEKKHIENMGGLYVIGTERHESRRIDNQLRGRSGRQGDPGSSRFFLSLEDNIFRIFGGKQIEKLMNTLNMDDNIPIESVILSKSLNAAQKKVESYFYDVRKQLFDYDEVVNNQRAAIYAERRRILKSEFTRDCIIEYGENTIDEILITYTNINSIQEKINILRNIIKLLNITTEFSINELILLNTKEIKYFFYEQFRITYDLRENYLENLRPGLVRQLEKYYLLQQIDKGWQDHLEKMALLKEYIGWRSYGQQDPLIEYKNEAFNLFTNMVTYIRQTVLYLAMRSRLIVYT